MGDKFQSKLTEGMNLGELFSAWLPGITKEDMNDLLWNATCYPAGDFLQIEQQVAAMSLLWPDKQAIMKKSMDDLDAAMRAIPHDPQATITSG